MNIEKVITKLENIEELGGKILMAIFPWFLLALFFTLIIAAALILKRLL